MVELIDLPDQLIAGLRAEVNEGDLADFFGRAAAQAFALIPQDLIDGPLTQVVHRDEGHRFDVTIGLPVSADPGLEDLTLTHVAASAALREIHVGEYPDLGDAYARIDDDLRARGAFRSLALERYMSGPADSPDPGTWRTEVIVPIHFRDSDPEVALVR